MSVCTYIHCCMVYLKSVKRVDPKGCIARRKLALFVVVVFMR